MDKAEGRKEKIKNWLKNPYNLTFLGIMVFAFLIRFYYFFLTKNQTLWWDEAGYMAAAKSYAGIGNYQLEAIRLPGFPLLISLFFIIGVTSEPIIRFAALFIPSIVLILLTYFLIAEMYPDKRVALISTAIISVLWEHLFYSNRFHTENFALIFEFLAILILFKSYIKKENALFITPKYSLIWVALFSLISIIFRPGNAMFIPVIILFIAILNKTKLLSWRGLVFSLAIISLAVLSMIFYPKIPFIKTVVQFYYHPENPVAWNNLYVFYGFYKSILPWLPSLFFWGFLFGLFIFSIDFTIKFDKIKKIENNIEEIELKSDIFNMLLIIITLFAFVLIIRSYSGFEYRWFFPLLPGMLVFTGKGVIAFSEYVSDMLNNRKIVFFLIILLVGLGVYNQIIISDNLIKNKLLSYSQVKESGLWLKENSEPGDIIISASVPQHAYYSERRIEDFYVNNSNKNESAFNEYITQIKPRYFVISVFEPGFTPEWAYTYSERHNDTLIPVKAYTMQTEQGIRPVLIIYEMRFK